MKSHEQHMKLPWQKWKPRK